MQHQYRERRYHIFELMALFVAKTKVLLEALHREYPTEYLQKGHYFQR